jgi:hypothetical protein
VENIILIGKIYDKMVCLSAKTARQNRDDHLGKMKGKVNLHFK